MTPITKNQTTEKLLVKLRNLLYGTEGATKTTELHEFRFHLTLEDEYALAEGDVEQLGRPLAANILLQGVRASVPMLYGIPVIWDAKATALTTRVEAQSEEKP